MLRGAVEQPKVAGPTKEAAIASACLTGRWSREILDCIGTDRTPRTCLAKLTREQRVLLAKKVAGWVTINDGETVDFTIPAEPEVSCAVGIGQVASYAPPLRVTGEEASFALEIRKALLEDRCEAGWSNLVKQCFASQQPASACRGKLDPGEQQGITADLARIDKLMARIAATKTKPAGSYDCKSVVAVHYSNAMWRGRMPSSAPPRATRAELARLARDRLQVVAASRKAMFDVCTGEGWNATVRACQLIGDDLCERALGHPRTRWTFPAEGVFPSTGITDCDTYFGVVQAFARCRTAPASLAGQLQQQVQQMRLGLQTITDPAVRNAAAAGCKQAVLALRRSASALGCTI